MKIRTGARIGQKLCEHFKINPSMCKSISVHIIGGSVASFKFEMMCPEWQEDMVLDILKTDENHGA